MASQYTVTAIIEQVVRNDKIINVYVKTAEGEERTLQVEWQGHVRIWTRESVSFIDRSLTIVEACTLLCNLNIQGYKER